MEWLLEAHNLLLLRMKIWGSEQEMMPSLGYAVSWDKDLHLKLGPDNQVRDFLQRSTQSFSVIIAVRNSETHGNIHLIASFLTLKTFAPYYFKVKPKFFILISKDFCDFVPALLSSYVWCHFLSLTPMF